MNVLDVPEKPRLLQPDEIRAEYVKLSWSPPEDDGGTPITGYVVRMLDLEAGGEWITTNDVRLHCKIVSGSVQLLLTFFLF